MKFLLSSWGSSGDLHPFLALGQTLRGRGHDVTFAANPAWQVEIESAGMRFVPAGPHQSWDILFAYPELMSRRNLGINSARILMEQGVVPTLADVTRVLIEEAPRHDCLVAHHFVFPAHIAAEKTGIPWVSVTLAPGVIPSAYGLPGGALARARQGWVGRWFNRLIWASGRWVLGRMFDPAVNALRHAHGLPPRSGHFLGSVSRQLNLLLYSPTYAPPAPDFSAEKKAVGFCYWDPLAEYLPSPELVAFLAAGDKPWLFTLGSSAVTHPQGFYEAAVAAVRGTNRRAVLLVGRDENRPSSIPDNVVVLNYAPYGWIMPRCRGVAHQCGIGTTAQTLRAGLPSLCCPYAFDQPNNAMRLVEQGVGVLVVESQRSAAGFRAALAQAETEEVTGAAARLGEGILREQGPETASQCLEACIRPR